MKHEKKKVSLRNLSYIEILVRLSFISFSPYETPMKCKIEGVKSAVKIPFNVIPRLANAPYLLLKIIIKMYLVENKEVTLFIQLNW